MKGVPNNWIAVDCDIDDDDKTKAVARASGLTLNECVGAVVRVLARMRRKAPKGELAKVLNEDLNEWAGFAENHTFAAQFVKHFCSEARVVLSWMAYNGDMIERSRKAVKRIRKYRRDKQKERRNGKKDVTRNVTGNARRTKRERSVSPNPTLPNPSGLRVGGVGAAVALEPTGAQALPEVQELVRADPTSIDWRSELKNAERKPHLRALQ